MSSRPSLIYWLLFIVINVAVSALTTWFIVRQLVPSPTSTASALVVTGTPGSASITNTPDIIITSTPDSPGSTQALPTTSEPTSTSASSAGTATAAPASAPNTSSVRISAVIYPGQQSREVIIVVNEGSDINLSNWTISSPRGKVFTFGNLTLYKDSFINVHTTNGTNTPTDLFWSQTEPMWQTGDNVQLKQSDKVVSTYAVK